jgi:phosphoglycolate phosphatase
MAFESILFDLDGTLTDPKIGITKSIQYGLAKLGIEENDLDSLVSFIGAPLFACLQERYVLDEVQAERIVGYYREYYAQTGLYENDVYPGIPELLADLTAAGKKLAVATLKPTVYARQVLEHFNILDYFATVSGSNLDFAGLTKTRIIENALGQMAVVSGKYAVMVGDREHDVHAARANGIDSIAVTYGYGTNAELRNAAPTHIADSVDAVRELLL